MNNLQVSYLFSSERPSYLISIKTLLIQCIHAANENRVSKDENGNNLLHLIVESAIWDDLVSVENIFSIHGMLSQELQIDILNGVNNQGQTPFQLLLKADCNIDTKVYVGELLLRAGADPKTVGRYGQNWLHFLFLLLRTNSIEEKRYIDLCDRTILNSNSDVLTELLLDRDADQRSPLDLLLVTGGDEATHFLNRLFTLNLGFDLGEKIIDAVWTFCNQNIEFFSAFISKSFSSLPPFLQEKLTRDKNSATGETLLQAISNTKELDIREKIYLAEIVIHHEKNIHDAADIVDYLQKSLILFLEKLEGKRSFNNEKKDTLLNDLMLCFKRFYQIRQLQKPQGLFEEYWLTVLQTVKLPKSIFCILSQKLLDSEAGKQVLIQTLSHTFNPKFNDVEDRLQDVASAIGKHAIKDAVLAMNNSDGKALELMEEILKSKHEERSPLAKVFWKPRGRMACSPLYPGSALHEIRQKYKDRKRTSVAQSPDALMAAPRKLRPIGSDPINAQVQILNNTAGL